jgi:hypothetical protein
MNGQMVQRGVTKGIPCCLFLMACYFLGWVADVQSSEWIGLGENDLGNVTPVSNA